MMSVFVEMRKRTGVSFVVLEKQRSEIGTGGVGSFWEGCEVSMRGSKVLSRDRKDLLYFLDPSLAELELQLNESSYEVLEVFLRGVVVTAKVKQQRGYVACFVAKRRSRGACGCSRDYFE
nr:hypothetical protein [Tanacetum cinerariifolium]